MIALSDDIVIMQVQSQIESSVNMCIYKKNIESKKCISFKGIVTCHKESRHFFLGSRNLS